MEANDNDVINAAYQDELKKIWTNFLVDYTGANTDAEKKTIKASFTNRVKNARELRDLAITALP